MAIVSWILTHPVLVASGLVVLLLLSALRPILPSSSRPATTAPTAPDGALSLTPQSQAEEEMLSGLAPGCTLAQKRGALTWLREQAKRGLSASGVPRRCVVTGGTGFVGMRLVEMLIERGAEEVVCFDVVPPSPACWVHPRIKYVVGDITDKASIAAAVQGADCVWHNAACVGPFHPLSLYDKVNYHGTVNVIEACRAAGVKKIVMSSSPSTRFTGANVDGLSEDELPKLPLKSYMQAYASSKAKGEMEMSKASKNGLLTVAVAPHQVYGPRDNLFLPNMLEAAGTGLLRVFASGNTGWGMNRVCFTHVDNYAHGLIQAADALHPGSPALGKFYIVTDGDTHPYKEGYAYFWEELDRIIVGMGFTSIWSKVKLPTWLLYPLAYVGALVEMILRTKVKLNPFNVTVTTMHRWFRIDNAVRDLGFYPIIPYEEGWFDCMQWTRENWLPKFRSNSNKGMSGIATQSQNKIDIQARSALHAKKTE